MDNIAKEKIESLLGSFPADPVDRSDIRRARALEKRTVRLYRFLPHVIYIETLESRNYRKIYENSFSHKRDRMDECGRISFTSVKRKG